jgi:hypothetical protein
VTSVQDELDIRRVLALCPLHHPRSNQASTGFKGGERCEWFPSPLGPTPDRIIRVMIEAHLSL